MKEDNVAKPKVAYKNLPDASNVYFGSSSEKKKIYFTFEKEAKIKSKRSKFSDTADLISYVKSILGLSDGNDKELRLTVRCKGRYQKVNKLGRPVLTIGDPILDLISDDDGIIIVGNVKHNVQLQNTNRNVVQSINTRETKKFVDEETRESITFHAWKKSNVLYWTMGIEIETSGSHFEQAQINSQYGERSLQNLCAVVKTDADQDANDTYLDEYEWGINAPQPDGVRAACSAIWLNQEIIAFVEAGSGCDNWESELPLLEPFSEWNPNVIVPNLKSKAAPAVVEFNNRLHVVFIGEDSNDLYHWIFDGSQWMPAIGSTGKIPGQKSKNSPALAVHNNLLHMVHLGDSSNDIWHTTFNGTQWTTNVKTGQKSKDTPALEVFNGTLHMVHIGNDSNNLYHRVLNANQWVPLGANNGIIPDQKSKAGPALTRLAGGLYMVHLGNSSNDIWYSVFNGTQWSINQKIGQKSSTTPAVLGIKLVHIGSSSTSIWESDYLGPNWSLNRKIPGQASKDSPALARLNGRLYMIHLGESSNNLWISSYGNS